MRSPSNHLCLGYRLEQLSIGHLFLLADAKSPFIDGGLGTITDLSNAVFICCQPWRQSVRDSGRWWFPWFLKLWAWRSRKLDLNAEHDKFAAYFADETDFPMAKLDQFATREYGSPWWWRLLALMMSDFNMTEETAMNMPAARAAMLFSAKGEMEGKLKLWTKEDDSFDEFCRRMDSIPDAQFPEPNSN